MNWSFHYDGPIAPKVDLNCTTCLSGQRKICPTHGTQFAQGCAHCDCAKGGPCHAHWGLDAAFGALSVEKDAAEDFGEQKASALAYAAKTAKPNILVSMRGSVSETGIRELSVRIVPKG